MEIRPIRTSDDYQAAMREVSDYFDNEPTPGTPDGEWHAELKQGTTYLARNLAVAAAAVSRAAKELHDDLATPIDEIIEEARSQQAARVAALEAELEAARKVLSDLE